MRATTKKLCESAYPHVLIPSGLASRRGSSVHKLHNMLHTLFIETGAWSRVEKLCQSILMLTTDRGAERLLQSTPATMAELEQLNFLPTLATQTQAHDCEQQLETGEPNLSVDAPPPPPPAERPPPAPHHGARPGPRATRRDRPDKFSKAVNFVASRAGGIADVCCHNGCTNEIYACCIACLTPLCHVHFGSFQGEDHKQSRCHQHRHVTLLRPCPCLACKSSSSSSSGPPQHPSKPGPGHGPTAPPQAATVEEGEGDSFRRSAEYILGNCIWVPGVLHLMHHVVEGLLDSFQRKQEFLKELRTLCNFFKYKGLRERFQHQCLTGQNRRHSILFDDFPVVYIEWRWGSLLACLRHLLLIQPILVLCWDSERMVAKGQHASEQCGRDDDEFQKADSVEDVGRVIHSTLFWAFLQMFASLGQVTDRLTEWCQTCPCHPATSVRRVCRILEQTESSSSKMASCPFVGCRAPCMANGR